MTSLASRALIDLGEFYQLDYDQFRCKKCTRLQVVSWGSDGHDFPHQVNCPHGQSDSTAPRQPWKVLAEAIRTAAGQHPIPSIFPEHIKLDAIRPLSQAVGEFIDWLEEQGLTICIHAHGEFVPTLSRRDDLLAEYFGVDQTKLNAEKEVMLAMLREANNPLASDDHTSA